MCAIPSLGAKEEIKRQRIKFSDSELDLANQCTTILFVAFSAAVLFNYDGQRTEVA